LAFSGLKKQMANPKNLFLIGPMGAGKSAVGRQLGRLMHLNFVDSDEEIEERTGVDIHFIFEKEGEEGFRTREVKVIDELSQRQGIVLATGGGAVLDAESRSRLGARGFVVYLHTTVQQQLDRTRRGRNRPLLEGGGDREQILEVLMTARDPLYREIADLTVETDGRRVQAVARDIVDALG
jgi:shikimate kinase